MKLISRFKVIALALLFMGVTALAWAVRTIYIVNKDRPRIAVARHRSAIPEIVYDSVLLNKFERICERFNEPDMPLTYSGNISINDGADTVNSVNNIDFIYSRNQNNCYYKTGKSETLNAFGIYLYVEHDHKRVIVSTQKALQPMQPIANLTKLASKLQTEHYQLTAKKVGKNETLTLLNEHHISCKELSITFDSLTNAVENIRIRLTCVYDPLNRKKEKIVNVSIKRFEAMANLSSLINKDEIIEKGNNGWKLCAAYRGYQLIKIP